MLDMGFTPIVLVEVRLAANGRTRLYSTEQDGETVWIGWDAKDGKWVAEVGDP
jgi:hypothetical protein